MAVRVLLQFAKPTMRLAEPIWDIEGKPAAGQGSYLRESMVRMLRRMDLLSVVVEDTEDLPPWETVRPLEQDLLEMEERFADTPKAKPVNAIRAAIGRHLTRRAEALEADPVIHAMRDPKAGGGAA